MEHTGPEMYCTAKRDLRRRKNNNFAVRIFNHVQRCEKKTKCIIFLSLFLSPSYFCPIVRNCQDMTAAAKKEHRKKIFLAFWLFLCSSLLLFCPMMWKLPKGETIHYEFRFDVGNQLANSTECATNFYSLLNLPPLFYLYLYRQKIANKNQ